MADVTISYKNAEIATMNATGVKTLLTGDTFCEDDIVVAYTKPATPAPTLQSKTVYPSASDQTTTPDQGYDGLSSVISKGVLLTNLTADNIKKDVVVKVGDSVDDDRITAVTGTYEGSGGSGALVDEKTVSASGNSLVCSNLLGEPKMWVAVSKSPTLSITNLVLVAGGQFATNIAKAGTNSGTQVSISASYNNGTLTITGATGTKFTASYTLWYAY